MLSTMSKALKTPKGKSYLLSFWGWFYRSWVYRFYQYSWLYNLRWFLTHWYQHDNWIKTNLPISYHDKMILMEDGLFAMIEDFISRDKEDAPSVCYIDDDVMDKIIKILYFYRIRKPELEKEYEELLHETYGKGRFVFTPCPDKEGFSKLDMIYDDVYTPEWRDSMRKKLSELEVHIYDETQKHLHLCVDIRGYLWT